MKIKEKNNRKQNNKQKNQISYSLSTQISINMNKKFNKNKNKNINNYFTTFTFLYSIFITLLYSYLITPITTQQSSSLSNNLIISNINCKSFETINNDIVCNECIFPYTIGDLSYCYLDPETLMDDCMKTFYMIENYKCFLCKDFMYFDLVMNKCVSCYYNIDKCYDICEDDNCQICDDSDRGFCLRCKDESMVINEFGECVCARGSFLNDFEDLNNLSNIPENQTPFDKIYSNKCVSCKEAFGPYCKSCNKDHCLSCIQPYCKYYEKYKDCVCSLSFINSCEIFNGFDSSLYYDHNCYCFGRDRECVLDCKSAYDEDVVACDDKFGYYINYVEGVAEEGGEGGGSGSTGLVSSFGIENYFCQENCLLCNSNGDCLIDKNEVRQNCPKTEDYVFNQNKKICINCLEFTRPDNSTALIDNKTIEKLECHNSLVQKGSLCNAEFIKDCKVCDSQQGCLECRVGYYLELGRITHRNKSNLNSGKCYSCKNIDSRCVTCNDVICLSCEKGFKMDGQGICQPNSIEITNNQNNNNINNILRIYKPPCNDLACIECPVPSKCFQCKQGFVLDTITSLCIEFPCNIEHCLECSSRDICRVCKSPYFLKIRGVDYKNAYCGLNYTLMIVLLVIFIVIIILLIVFNGGCGCCYRKWYCFNEVIPLWYIKTRRFCGCERRKHFPLRPQEESGNIRRKIEESEKMNDCPLQYDKETGQFDFTSCKTKIHTKCKQRLKTSSIFSHSKNPLISNNNKNKTFNNINTESNNNNKDIDLNEEEEQQNENEQRNLIYGWKSEKKKRFFREKKLKDVKNSIHSKLLIGKKQERENEKEDNQENKIKGLLRNINKSIGKNSNNKNSRSSGSALNSVRSNHGSGASDTLVEFKEYKIIISEAEEDVGNERGGYIKELYNVESKGDKDNDDNDNEIRNNKEDGIESEEGLNK